MKDVGCLMGERVQFHEKKTFLRAARDYMRKVHYIQAFEARLRERELRSQCTMAPQRSAVMVRSLQEIE